MDTKLIAEVQRKCGGAKIHAARQIINHYVLAFKVGLPKEEIEKIERELRVLIHRR